MRKPCIFLAQEASLLDAASVALSEFDIIPALTLSEAQSLIVKDIIDLFVIGIHFDESHALELVRLVRATGKHICTPIILIRAMPSPLAKSIRRSVQALSAIYDIATYLELEESLDPDEDLVNTVRRQLSKVC